MRGTKGRIIFSLDDLEIGKLWYSEHGNSIMRQSATEVLLGDSITVPIIRPQSFSMLSDAVDKQAKTAENVVERITGVPVSMGLPIASIEKNGEKSRHGRVVFDLRELPVMQDVVFSGRTKGLLHKACRLTDKLVLIDSVEYPLESPCVVVEEKSSSSPPTTAPPTPSAPGESSSVATATPHVDLIDEDEPNVSPHGNKEEYRAHLQESIEKKRAAIREQRKKQMMEELQSKYG